ncbi:hypothetical protein B484DRAFT_449486 [Ochromonadaceae sp. CCMP2298]|nr:hypothetical protein B484DRAFT_449486 [Ochromonadaceae sp. CCMP2298]|mmetsp:Transcript_17878/g.39642  ORF Transcript_17878/g.39642 Transcript_17878/m.39642 type:complete len:82 (+) Transcript_17878:123-368(+)|eukprot:CAMPEP_0173178836 /NCGR_PEP_ID=MMETSP1141-20130122/5763_1 /TAXON_ID=483371 /ORGANISM="non described non described, Strain CCMP2298" /LENGTH=81 /DNA_ID=CAMNT_0014101383 /DNA_START=119 /DNA_END=364 /DNA_ORIENTATION=+
MHPPLFKDHPDCQETVKDLVKCHEEHQYGKFWGACNDFKASLDLCFRAEKEERRKNNFNKAREQQQKFDSYMAKDDAKGKK